MAARMLIILFLFSFHVSSAQYFSKEKELIGKVNMAATDAPKIKHGDN
jgi:hypothetical protein